MSNYSGQVPDTHTRRRDWQANAACLEEDPEIFFEGRFAFLARRVCVVSCPVRVECLENILEEERGEAADRRHGIVAGLDSRERWRLDPTAPGHGDGHLLLKLDTPDPICGTHEALVRHLSRGQQVDADCWSGAVRRARESSRQRAEMAKRATQEAPAPAPAATPAASAVPAPPAKAALPKVPSGATHKQRHVYRLWAQGLPDFQIARRADLSTQAVCRIRNTFGLIANPQPTES